MPAPRSTQTEIRTCACRTFGGQIFSGPIFSGQRFAGQAIAGQSSAGRGRRDTLRFLAAGAALLGLPAGARAADDKQYEAMLLSCIDPRFVDPVHSYMSGRDLSGQYSQFTIAGAAIGVVAPKFEAWHQAFWDNFATSLTLHKITAVIAIDHRDCGAAKIAYGPDSIATPEAETQLHRRVMAQFRAEVARRHRDVTVETWLMPFSGAPERID
jgi:carbonic anhydrase